MTIGDSIALILLYALWTGYFNLFAWAIGSSNRKSRRIGAIFRITAWLPPVGLVITLGYLNLAIWRQARKLPSTPAKVARNIRNTFRDAF